MTYVFVGGSQRSGTSLLAASMCAGKETNQYLGESGGMRSLLQTYNHMAQRFDDESVFHFGSRQAMDEYYSAMLKMYLSQTLTCHAPASSLVLKEPHLTMHFGQIHRLLPHSLFVMLKRDPRDIAASMVRVGEKLKAKGSRHLFNSGDMARIAESIAQFYRPVIAACNNNPAFKERCLWVTYDQLVSEPMIVIDQIRDFTGLKIELFDEKNPTKRTLPAKKKSREQSARAKPWNTSLMKNKGMSTASLGAFKDKLSADDITLIEKTIGGLIKRFGYELTTETD